MRIGLAYNEKPDSTSLDEPPSSSDTYVEWDDPSTIAAVEQALRLCGDVIRLEADSSFPEHLARTRPDLVFNIAEGLHGVARESHVPAICEYTGVPYTGSDPLTLGLALHKARAKEILAYRGVPTAPFALIEHSADLGRVALRFPLFVKPVAEGSGKGIFDRNLCAGPEQLHAQALFLLEEYAQPVLVESYLPGPEFTVAILGNGSDAHCLPIVAFNFDTLPGGAAPVYGYEAKWVWDTPARPLQIFECPARVPERLVKEIERVSLDAFHALGCRDWCRVDVRVDRFGVPNIIELNPLPGILPDPAMNSCFPKAARTAGLGYDELIREVVRIALKRIAGRDVGARHALPPHAALNHAEPPHMPAGLSA